MARIFSVVTASLRRVGGQADSGGRATSLAPCVLIAVLSLFGVLGLLGGTVPLAAQKILPLTPAAAGSQQTASAPTVSIPAGRAAKNVAIITIRGEIDAKGVMLMSINRRIDQAMKDGAGAIVFDIDCPGGAMTTTLRICEAIKACPIQNTVAWVNPQAHSGAALIALACRELIVNDPATLGDAMPILVTSANWGRGRSAAAPTDLETLKKVLPPLLAEVTDSARRYNARSGGYLRDEYLSQAMIANDVALWWVRNKTSGQQMCIDATELELLFPGASTTGATRLASAPGTGKLQLPTPPTSTTAPGVPSGSFKIAVAGPSMTVAGATMRPVLTASDAGAWELIDKVKDDSLPALLTADDLFHYGFVDNNVTTTGGVPALVPIRTDADIKSFFGAVNVQRYDSSWSEALMDILTGRLVQAALVVIFLIALFVEMTHPGAVLPGVISATALCLLIAPGLLVGMAAWWEVLAIIAGIGLIGLEILVIPGFGVPGLLGLLLLFVGLIGLFVPGNTGPFPDSPQARDDVLWAAVTLILSFSTAGLAMYFIAKHFGSLPLLGRLVLKSPASDEESADMLAAMTDMDDLPVKVGDRGVALTMLRPAGRVQVGDRVVDAVAEIGFIDSGMNVRIVNASAMRIGVEQV